MNNAEWMIKQGYKFEDIRLTSLNDRVAVIDVNGKKDPLIIQTQGVLYSFMKWLDEEHNESILDDAEKRYGTCEWLSFFSKDEYGSFYLPNFKAGTMYKGMELNRKYTLEELGL